MVSEVLVLINQDVLRFSNLKECLNGISDNVLSSVLNKLVKSKLVEKETFHQVPLRVDYHITPVGLALTRVMHDLCDLGKEHISYEIRIKPTFPGKDQSD